MKDDKTIKAFWYSSNNFGDALNYFLLSKLSGKQVLMSERNWPHYIAAGSILTEANELSTVWGAGIANKEDYVNPSCTIVSVRGKLSREACFRSGHTYDITLGDPALLMPELYQSKGELKYPIGIIPHWKEVDKCVSYFGDTTEVLIINPFQDIFSFIDSVCSCSEIFSSSLHGLIISDAYKIPNRWITFGKEIGGDGTKFHDYYSNTGPYRLPLLVNINQLPKEETSIQDNSEIIKQIKTSNPFL